jgi:hypothetical protein
MWPAHETIIPETLHDEPHGVARNDSEEVSVDAEKKDKTTVVQV